MEERPDVRLKTIKKVEKQFDKDKAWSIRGLSDELNLNFYSIKSCIRHLVDENKIRSLDSSSRGDLFVRA